MATYGYCRISTRKQSIKRQVDNVKAYAPDAVIFQEVFTGTRHADERPEFSRLLKRLRPGDVVIFDELSRMSRNAEDGIALYRDLFDRGIELIFLKEHSLDSRNYREIQKIALTGDEVADVFIEATNRVLHLLAEKQIRSAFEGAQHEVEALRARTSDGMRASGAGAKISQAKTGTRYHTKKSEEAKAVILKTSRAFGGNLKDGEIMKLTGISRGSFYQYKKELMEEYGPIRWKE